MRQIILGIDPGSRCTGYGLIWTQGSEQGCIAHGCIRTESESFADRLVEIYSNLLKIISEYKPHEGAIERVFVQKNVQSALKLGQARGVALVAMAIQGLQVAEYSPREIKQAAVGYGAADKEQVQRMVSALLQLKTKPQADAADALAIAVCHANTRLLASQMLNATQKWKEAL